MGEFVWTMSMVILVWAFIVMLTVGGVLLICMGVKDEDATPSIVGVILLIISFIAIYSLSYDAYETSTPAAIDVYRGNTTLEITYRDSVPVDSVVVFKDKVK